MGTIYTLRDDKYCDDSTSMNAYVNFAMTIRYWLQSGCLHG